MEEICYFCEKNKAEIKTDDNYNLCSFCYGKITKTCSQCGKIVVNVFKSEDKHYCNDCAKEKANYDFFNVLGRLGNYEKI